MNATGRAARRASERQHDERRPWLACRLKMMNFIIQGIKHCGKLWMVKSLLAAQVELHTAVLRRLKATGLEQNKLKCNVALLSLVIFQ